MLKKLETRPLRVMFLLTSMPIGGAETLLLNLVRQVDKERVVPLIGCLKHKDVLGAELETEVLVLENLIKHKFDVGVLFRLRRLFLDQQVDAVVTVGAGDKMFWGRMAARLAGVPVILSALHSTGWPDGVGRLNRMLTGITDGFIAVAQQHAEYQIREEKFPASKVFMIPNGIDTNRFAFDQNSRVRWRETIGIPHDAPVVGIVAALRSEKNHRLFLEVARRVKDKLPQAQFVIAGDGPERERLEACSRQFGISQAVHFLGSVQDIPGVLAMLDVFALTSDNEASPVSIMEALACERPVVAPAVGSIDESVLDGRTGFLVAPRDAEAMANCWIELLGDSKLSHRLGRQGREHAIESCSLDTMTAGYMELIEDIFTNKRGQPVVTGSGFVSWGHFIPEDPAATSTNSRSHET